MVHDTNGINTVNSNGNKVCGFIETAPAKVNFALFRKSNFPIVVGGVYIQYTAAQNETRK